MNISDFYNEVNSSTISNEAKDFIKTLIETCDNSFSDLKAIRLYSSKLNSDVFELFPEELTHHLCSEYADQRFNETKRILNVTIL